MQSYNNVTDNHCQNVFGLVFCTSVYREFVISNRQIKFGPWPLLTFLLTDIPHIH